LSEEDRQEQTISGTSSHKSVSREASDVLDKSHNIQGWVEKALESMQHDDVPSDMFDQFIFNEDLEEAYRRWEQIALDHYFTLYHSVRQDDWQELEHCDSAVTCIDSANSIVNSSPHNSLSASFRKQEAVTLLS
jgi:hypothetical protein